jgi:hypothetical protein
VGLSGAGTADQDDIVGHAHKLTAMELADQRFVDLAAGKVEAGQISIDREARRLELIGDRSTSRSAVSAFRSCDRIGTAASNAGDPCSMSSVTACAMPCIFRLRSMMTMAPLAGS